MPNDQTYALVLRSPSVQPADLRVTLYSVSATYRLQLNAVSFGDGAVKLNPEGSSAYESQPYFIALPHADVVIGASVEPANATSAPACEPRYTLSDYLSKQLNPDYVPSERRTLERAQLNRAFLQGISAVPVSTTAENKTSCDKPYTPARRLKHVVPNPTFKLSGITETTTEVAVSVDSSGAVSDATIVQRSDSEAWDEVVLDSARRSTYEAATFLCHPIASVYLTKSTLHVTNRMRIVH
jgi:hypothetical protein